jgi:hypothetical protein
MFLVLKTQQISMNQDIYQQIKILPSLTYFLLVLVSEFLRKNPNSFPIKSIENLMQKKSGNLQTILSIYNVLKKEHKYENSYLNQFSCLVKSL